MPVRIAFFIGGLVAFSYKPLQAEPPFFGTIFIDPDIITSADPTSFEGVTDAGRGFRVMYDRRVNDWINVNAYLFNANFDDGLATEIQVNPEFGNTFAARTEAQKYGEVIGRLPTSLRADAESVWIHKGIEPFGGGNNNLLIYTGQADLYEADGILEETLVHESAHTSLDATHASAPSWRAAQDTDGDFISTYARDNPNREDVAESFLPYLAVRYRSDRISEALADTISNTIPNRIEYFDDQSLDLYPLVKTRLLQAGDADQDFDFDQLDLVQVLQRAKYLTGSSATWGEGDWDGAPGGSKGNPPPGNGLFDQLDIIAALNGSMCGLSYCIGPYAALGQSVVGGDGHTSLDYDTIAGELHMDTLEEKELTSTNLTSAGSSFIGNEPASLEGALDNFAADNLFKATFGSSFGRLKIGDILPKGLGEAQIATDPSVAGFQAGVGDLREVDLELLPEPSAVILLCLGMAAAMVVRLARG